MFETRRPSVFGGATGLKIAVVGTGRIGLPFAAVCSRYFPTIGIDIDKKTIQVINNHGPHSEPSLGEYLRKYELKGTNDFSQIKNNDLIFISVGSQSPGEGYSSNNLLKALDAVEPYLDSRSQALVIITTVPLSSFQTLILPHLAKKRVLERIQGLCYNPTMVALGNAIQGFEHPDYVLIGESSPDAGAQLVNFWRKVVGDKVRIFRSTLSNVELAKYSLNTALVLKITLMNALTELAEKTGAEVDFQADVLRADPRISGPKMFKGGMGYGGTCYPVDVEALRAACERLGVPTDLADAMRVFNDRQVQRTVQLIKSLGKNKVTILGASYKPDTSIVAASQSLQVAELLAEQDCEIMLYDPVALDAARTQLGDRAQYCDDIKKAIEFGSVVFLGVEWPQIRNLSAESFRPDQVVIDPWRMLDSTPLRCTYVPYGKGR